MNDLVFKLKVNNIYADYDAYTSYGVRMHNDFLSNLFAPRPIKERIENESRMQHGKEIVFNEKRYASREVTLNFTISETTTHTYAENKAAFIALLERPELLYLNVPSRSLDEVFKLQYKDSTSYAENWQGTFGSIAVKFCEPNPNDRTIEESQKPSVS